MNEYQILVQGGNDQQLKCQGEWTLVSLPFSLSTVLTRLCTEYFVLNYFSSSLQSQHPILLAHHMTTHVHLPLVCSWPVCQCFLWLPEMMSQEVCLHWDLREDRWFSYLPPTSHLQLRLLMTFPGAAGSHCSLSWVSSLHGSVVSGEWVCWWPWQS